MLCGGKILFCWLMFILRMLSAIYGLAVSATRKAYENGWLRRTRLSCRVISVGNITWGGTGKTPFTAMLAKHLRRKGHNVVILTRGYRGAFRPWTVNRRPTISDEAVWLRQETDVPVIVGRDRARKGKEAISRYKPDFIILDDGFQHWPLHRDVDIVSINSLNPFGNGQLLPQGILREPLSQLSRADVFVLAKSDLTDNLSDTEKTLRAANPRALIIFARHNPLYFYDPRGGRLAPGRIKDKTVVLFSAIGDPLSFKKTIMRLGGKIGAELEFPDHYNYRNRDIDLILKRCRTLKADAVVTTEKDKVKLSPQMLAAMSDRLLILKIGTDIIGDEEKLYRRLSGR
ncbi:MAG: tetraacyldisaccharide 4'-kinase [Candidatus Omnitrophota bacterium]